MELPKKLLSLLNRVFILRNTLSLIHALNGDKIKAVGISFSNIYLNCVVKYTVQNNGHKSLDRTFVL